MRRSDVSEALSHCVRRHPGRMSVYAASGAPRLVAQPTDAQRSMQNTPLYKPLGAQRRPIHILASHAELARPLLGSVQLDPAASSFVRPDVPPLSDDEGAVGRGVKTTTLPAKAFGSNKSYASNAKFRSALEQARTSHIFIDRQSAAELVTPSPATVVDLGRLYCNGINGSVVGLSPAALSGSCKWACVAPLRSFKQIVWWLLALACQVVTQLLPRCCCCTGKWWYLSRMLLFRRHAGFCAGVMDDLFGAS